jgi:hypothetical protein
MGYLRTRFGPKCRTGLGPDWGRTGTGLRPDWDRTGTGLGPDWARTEAGLESDWVRKDQAGVGLVQDWGSATNGYGSGPGPCMTGWTAV